MKIAFLNIYNGVIDRGAETFVKELAKRLSKENKVVVFQSGEANGKEEFEVKKINVKWDWSNKSGVGTLRSLFFLDYWNRQIFYFTLKCLPDLFKQKFDIVIPVNGGWQPAIIRIATWILRTKMIVSGQSGKGWDDRNNIWSFPNLFVATSENALAWAKQINPFIKYSFIPNGVDLEKFTPGGEKLSTKLKSPIVLCVGALTPTKRIHLAIEAVARLKNASLLVIGDGDLKSEIVKLGNDLLGDRFELLKLSHEDMPKAYRSADIFTIPSESYYSFEIVIVEAMASGLSAVVNDDPIRREIVGDAGLLVDPINTEEYGEKINRALNTKWGDKPRKQAGKFSWDKIADQYQKLLKNL